MDRFRIEGGGRLQGTVRISGAKNSALPAMAAALLSAEPVHLKNIPRVRDIVTMGRLLAHMGAEISTEHGYVAATVPEGGRLPGGQVIFEKITVTGTENILMAAVLADGETCIENAALEPEVTDLIELLTKMGARIEGCGTSSLRVQGVER